MILVVNVNHKKKKEIKIKWVFYLSTKLNINVVGIYNF